MNKSLLIVVDMQNDFIDGQFGTREAQAIVPKVCKKIRSFEGDILYTKDSHYQATYLDDEESKFYPIHCIEGSYGWDMNVDILKELSAVAIDRKNKVFKAYKSVFAPIDTLEQYTFYKDVTIIGLCTDICVVSTALALRSINPEAKITVDGSCCAGTNPVANSAALLVMRKCGIYVENQPDIKI